MVSLNNSDHLKQLRLGDYAVIMVGLVSGTVLYNSEGPNLEVESGQVVLTRSLKDARTSFEVSKTKDDLQF